MKVVVGLLVLVLGIRGGGSACGASRPAACHAATFTADIAAGAHFERPIGEGLTFRLDPQDLGPEGAVNGWRMTIVPTRAPTEDYIYPVNPPLRFNGIQIFGPSYGDDTRTSLSHRHDVHFLLKGADYDRISPLLTNALWPYSAPRPDTAADDYTRSLKSVATGLLKVAVISSETVPGTDSLRRMTVRADFITPVHFTFAPELRPRPVTCPQPDEP